ncbi:hypothetical protein [Flavobacterium sp.]|uniref:hypothetical protein n=1 Tax=Flavobacterium sp. TaxID=239 RepID=UPI00260CA787|nr:hypothetical protein [Flavobacterium sp.]MDD2986099.1 hypothetical protein [Flavobacterium sp.]
MSLGNIKSQVEKLHHQILECAQNSSEINSLYKGCQIWYSPILLKPKVLLIGFNPGAGYYNWEGKIVEQFEPLNALEYYLTDHSLAKQTIKLFQIMEKEDVLKYQTVKTNFYFFATSNVSDFNKLTKLLPKELSTQLFHFARVWIKQLIETLEPELILCEGTVSFAEVAVLFDDKFAQESSTYHQQFKTAKTIVFSYKRNQSSIIDKEQVALILRNLVK